MENNRTLLISMAGTRKTKHWPRTELTWAEFVEKLKTPVRSIETLEEYLSYAKVKQDELKDVGGFVGGVFAGDIRKAAYVEGRDLLTLDLDNIPAGRTEDILKRVAGLGCNAAVYSTRKHCGYKPRLRVIVPLDRTASADEYEPAARKLASLIGIEFCDPTTFDVARLMYWPSCCRDSEYVCEVYDRPFCSLDGLLQMYGDWTDITQWPQVPGTDAVERRRLAKQENPTEKKGIIGAFCRTYSITQAMEKFIPGMYEPTAMDGRYTYTGGSTIGGAIVYDGDLFLYSHHATDPCSGLLVNAFDLIRLHKFGDLDQEAKEGTPNSKLPSFMAMTRLASNAVMRKSLCAAVARAIVGAVKYDYLPIFTGPQGIGKSTFLSILGREWFSDSLTSFEGKEAAELIQGTWINEVGELTAMTTQETNAVKQFLSKTDDIYRAAYGRRTNKYPRRCVFFGTSNEEEFLKDMTGNRRFWPVDVGVHQAKKSVWNELPQEVDQIWAEAYMYWKMGEPLYMSREEEEMAVEMQESHRESSGKEGIIREFLERKIPSNWDSLSLMLRKQFLSGNLRLGENIQLVDRSKVCALEIWTECFGGDARYMKRTDSREINQILSSLKGWKPNRSKRRYGPHGIQKGFERVTASVDIVEK